MGADKMITIVASRAGLLDLAHSETIFSGFQFNANFKRSET